MPFEFVGTAKGADLGGELVVHNSTIQVEGLPLDIPDNVSVDISDLAIGDSIPYSAIELPANVQMLSSASTLFVEVRVASEVSIPVEEVSTPVEEVSTPVE